MRLSDNLREALRERLRPPCLKSRIPCFSLFFFLIAAPKISTIVSSGCRENQLNNFFRTCHRLKNGQSQEKSRRGLAGKKRQKALPAAFYLLFSPTLQYCFFGTNTGARADGPASPPANAQWIRKMPAVIGDGRIQRAFGPTCQVLPPRQKERTCGNI